MDVAVNYTIGEIAGILHARVSGEINYTEGPLHILLDSRKLVFPERTVFFALDSGRRNGAAFIKDLYEKNVRYFVTRDSINTDEYPGSVFLFTDNVLVALQALAAHHRKQFSIPVIGITGSNGKTVVKEWLYQLLEPDHTISRSPKSYNSQVGVPLSIMQMDHEHTLAIIEAGISKPGEMERLQRMIHPSIGIFTNIGEAHSDGFESQIQKINEKLILFRDAHAIVFNNDSNDIREQVRLKCQGQQLFTWGRETESIVKITSVVKKNGNTVINAFYKKEISIIIPFTDNASIENAISCWCVLLNMNMDEKVIAERMMLLQPVEMRLQMKQGINNCTVINDSYSADINSLKIALDFLHQQKQHTKQTVVLSDILQSGRAAGELYGDVASLLRQKKIRRLIAVGPLISSQQEQFDFIPERYFFSDVESCIQHMVDAGLHHGLYFRDETILLKGARAFRFEQIDRLLEQKVHQTILTINLTAVAHNCKVYQSMLEPGVKTMAMVKAFSYGSGSFEIAGILQYNHLDYLAVAYVDEGIELRKAGITLPIMVMNPDENAFYALTEYSLEPEIFSFAILSSFEKYIRSCGLLYFPVHIKLDTGLHRLGFQQEDVPLLAARLSGNNAVKIQSVFSHLVASNDPQHDDITNKQGVVFLECCRQLEKVLAYPFIKHIANTNAISRFPHLQLDMVRLGIGLYGIDGDPQMQKKLRNVSALTTSISQIKHVKAGNSVGYGGDSFLSNDAVIATVRIGYADGYPRALSRGKGKMMINNQPVPVAGNVCMDMTMLDVTGVECNEGDEVLVFGEQLPLQQIAMWADTIPYEIMTGVSQRVKRVYYEE